MQASAPDASKTSSMYAPCAPRRGPASSAKAAAVQSAIHVAGRFKPWAQHGRSQSRCRALPVLLLELHPGLPRDPGDVLHALRVSTSERHRAGGDDPLLEKRQRLLARQPERHRRRLTRRQIEDVAQEVVGAPPPNLRIVAVAAPGPAHRREVDENEPLRALAVGQLAVVRPLLVRTLGV